MRRSTITTFVIALLAATAAAAAPQPKRKSKGVAIPLIKRNSTTLLHPNNTIDFDAIDAHAASVSAKIVRGLDNYEDNTGTRHPSVLERTGPQKRDGRFALTRYRNYFWHGTLLIGSPAKEFNEIDTGSADLFVRAASEGGITPEHVWDPSSSSTANGLNLPFDMLFANEDGALGEQYTDTVTMGDFTADKQTIGAATTFKFMGKSDGSPVDGILGLAFQSISTFPATPLFETLINENKVTDPMFSFHLSSSGGELFIGGTNEALYRKDTLIYTDVTERGYWQSKMDEMQANGQTIMRGVDVVFDTGANFIFGGNIEVYTLHRALGGKLIKPGYYSLPCHANPEPSVIFTFGGRPFKIPIEMLRLRPITLSGQDCLSAIVAQTAPFSFWSIGAPFLQSVYTVFDYGTGPQPTPRVGFAQLA